MSVTFFIDVHDKRDKKFVENEVQRTIITLMLEYPTISAKKIAEKADMSSRGVQKNIDTLKKAGLVDRLGSAKCGHWVIKSKPVSLDTFIFCNFSLSRLTDIFAGGYSAYPV